MEMIRVIVLIDMPSGTRHERKVSREYREWLFGQGFTTLQEGVCTRCFDGRAAASTCMRKLEHARPETGTVRAWALTESQFSGGLLVAGEATPQESEIGSRLDIFL